MVEKYSKNDFLSLLDFVRHNSSEDFYVTNNNSRQIIKDDSSVKQFLKECSNIFIVEERGDIIGIIGLWESKGNNLSRFYIKLNSLTDEVADKLLNVFIWNVNKELYAKIKKNSKFYKVFRNNRFNFIGDRGSEVLLYNPNRKKINGNNNNKSSQSNSRQ